MKRSTRAAVATTVVAAVALLGWGAKSVFDSMLGPPDDHVAAQDSRVCRQTSGNNLSFADATRHFSLVVPASATHVVFTADTGGLQGESDLMLRFTTTPAGLAAFLAASHFTPPSTTTPLVTGGGDWSTYSPGTPVRPAQGPCGLTPPVNPTMAYSADAPDVGRSGSARSLAVDRTTDPAHPVVWITGTDL